ncbi:MAG: hypothetical protein K2X03_04805 [Bryobacteraceae bacterium]|nr:hypothetical protein [Bryobacteraceae bacterium]
MSQRQRWIAAGRQPTITATTAAAAVTYPLTHSCCTIQVGNAMDGDVRELLEQIEAAFEIKFRPGELGDASCLSDLHAAVQSRLANKPAESCFSSVVFWKLRRACVDCVSSFKGSIRPATSVDSVLPKLLRRRAWQELSAASGLKLPGLEYSSFCSSVIFVAAGALPAILVATAGFGWDTPFATLVLWPVSAAILLFALRPMADQLSAQSRTFGELTKTVVGLNHGLLVREFGACRESETYQALRYVIGDLIDIDPNVLVGEDPRLIDLVLANDGFRASV